MVSLQTPRFKNVFVSKQSIKLVAKLTVWMLKMITWIIPKNTASVAQFTELNILTHSSVL